MQNEIKELPEFLAKLYKKNLENCVCGCGCELQLGKIYGYPHPFGWDVPEFEEKQWLFVQCPKCQHQWSLWKLGVAKDFHIDSVQYETEKGKFYRDMVFCPECKRAIEISTHDKYEALKNHASIFHPFI